MTVIDASVGSKWFLKKEWGSHQAKVILENHLSKTEEIIIPDLFLYEIANMLSTKTEISLWKITRSLNKLYKAKFKIFYPEESHIKLAAKLAKKFKTSVYDMLYAVVAKHHKAILITADVEFIKQTGFKFVKTLDL